MKVKFLNKKFLCQKQVTNPIMAMTKQLISSRELKKNFK